MQVSHLQVGLWIYRLISILRELLAKDEKLPVEWPSSPSGFRKGLEEEVKPLISISELALKYCDEWSPESTGVLQSVAEQQGY